MYIFVKVELKLFSVETPHITQLS